MCFGRPPSPQMEYDMDIPSLRTAEIDANVAGGINSAKDEDVLDI